MELVNVTISFRSGLPVWLSAQPRCLRRISKITPYSGLFFYFSLEQDFRIVVLRKSLESPLDCKEIQPVNPKGSQPWIFIGRANVEAPIFWPPDMKSWSSEKALMLGKTEGRKRRGQQRMRWLDSITDSMDMNLRKLRETVEDRGAWQAIVHGFTKSWTRFSN